MTRNSFSVRFHVSKPKHQAHNKIDDLCFLLQSSSFLFATQPRLRLGYAEDNSPLKSTISTLAVNSIHKSEKIGIGIPKINIMINWECGDWVTQLRHGESMLLEGRQTRVSQDEGFEQSFHFFCDEARFLWFEFKAREDTTAIAIGRRECGSELACGQQSRKKLVILKIRLGFVRDRPVLLTCKS